MKKATNILSAYVRHRFDLSEELPKSKVHEETTTKINPLSVPFCQIANDINDKISCVEKVHIHKCNKFCLRHKRNT